MPAGYIIHQDGSYVKLYFGNLRSYRDIFRHVCGKSTHVPLLFSRREVFGRRVSRPGSNRSRDILQNNFRRFKNEVHKENFKTRRFFMKKRSNILIFLTLLFLLGTTTQAGVYEKLLKKAKE